MSIGRVEKIEARGPRNEDELVDELVRSSVEDLSRKDLDSLQKAYVYGYRRGIQFALGNGGAPLEFLECITTMLGFSLKCMFDVYVNPSTAPTENPDTIRKQILNDLARTRTMRIHWMRRSRVTVKRARPR